MKKKYTVKDIKPSHFLAVEPDELWSTETHFLLMRGDKYGQHIEGKHLYKSDFTPKAWEKLCEDDEEN